MATITGASIDQASPDLRLTPETYTTINQLLKANKDFVMPELVQSYGDQGITGFLRLTGAVNSGGTSDQIDWWEAGRRHRTLSGAVSASAAGSAGTAPGVATFTVDDTNGSGDGTDSALGLVQANDVLMNATTGIKYLVNSAPASADAALKLERLDGANASPADNASGITMIHLGNIYAQGTDQPTHFTDADIKKYSNPFQIVKDRYQVNGSQATNIGWVNLGNGEYRWFMYGEQEARKRFEDRREMMMLFGEKNAATASDDGDNDLGKALAGSEGYFSAIEDRGINVSNANANPMDSLSEFDDLIIQLDKQGAPAEYAMYLNRKQDLAIDDMLASGIATATTAGLPGQFGAFNNDAEMAVKLGFKSFTRGGYTFHKHDWKLLNDPTLLGASNYIQGAMVPLANVADARSGMKAPSLSLYYKEANGYSREMEHWVTGGGVMGHNNNGDAGNDSMTFHYRSETALCVRAANQHVLIKG
tara:strand:+ start:11898 stop:13328 length:1431 start_codon:yes stop_codon:yes gene_type:complete